MKNPSFSTGLSKSQLERLALLSEELGEAQHMVGKILRHGYDSVSPIVSEPIENRHLLEAELGHVLHAIDRMNFSGDLSFGMIALGADDKAVSVKPYLHYQEKTGFDQRAEGSHTRIYRRMA